MLDNMTVHERANALMAEYTMRIAGSNVTMTGAAWVELVESVHPASPMGQRIRERLEAGPDLGNG